MTEAKWGVDAEAQRVLSTHAQWHVRLDLSAGCSGLWGLIVWEKIRIPVMHRVSRQRVSRERKLDLEGMAGVRGEEHEDMLEKRGVSLRGDVSHATMPLLRPC